MSTGRDDSLEVPSASPRGTNAQHPLARLPEEWARFMVEQGERPFRADQVFRWMHQRGVLDPNQMSDLPKSLRIRLSEWGVSDPTRVVQVQRSEDGTRKLLLELGRGGRIECVLIPMTRTQDADLAALDEDEVSSEPPAERVTLCVSTQFGCAMGCVFCASGQAGLTRGLDAAEIVAQVIVAKRYLEPGEKLRNLVFMGMGEPLHHYAESARAIRVLGEPRGLGMGPRRITVSTVGLVPGIERLGADFDGKVGLAVSLHAPSDALRDRIMPMNQRYPLATLLDALRRYPLPQRRRITIEYTLIRDLNDGEAHARALAKLLRGLRVKVNLIPMNPIFGSELQPSPPARVAAFRELLANSGYSCFVRGRRGDDVSAACGQLAFPEGSASPNEGIAGGGA